MAQVPSKFSWIEPPPLPKELAKFHETSMDQMRREINRQFLFGSSKPKKKDDVAPTTMDYHNVAKEVWNSESMREQMYGANPFVTTETITIPLEKKTMTTSKDLRKQAKSLRKEAERLERDEKRARKQAKARRQEIKVQARRREAAQAALEAIATDEKARKEDRVEAARVLLDRGY